MDTKRIDEALAVLALLEKHQIPEQVQAIIKIRRRLMEAKVRFSDAAD
jgi:hypothetical protein